jgi:hypothetical protein
MKKRKNPPNRMKIGRSPRPGGKLLFVKASIISVLVLGQRIPDRRRLELITFPRFEVPRHEGGSLNVGHHRKTREG